MRTLLLLLCSIAAIAQNTVAERLGYPADARLLLIQVDLGMMHSIDRAGFEAMERNMATTATIIVPCPWFPEAAEFAKRHPEMDFGLHLALNSEWHVYRWGPVSRSALATTLLDGSGYFPMTEAEVVAHAKPAEVEQEFRAQIEKAKKAGIRVTHVDSHMSTVFSSPELFSAYQKVANEYGLLYLIPRTSKFAKKAPANAVLIDREIQMKPGVPPAEWLTWYKRELSALPPGVYQLVIHVGYDDEELRGATEGRDWGAKWRQTDWDVIRSAAFQQFLREQTFVLVNWGDLARTLP